jgi:hypothetical protein
MRFCRCYFEKHKFLLHLSVRMYLGNITVGDSKPWLQCFRKKVEQFRKNVAIFKKNGNIISFYVCVRIEGSTIVHYVVI